MGHFVGADQSEYDAYLLHVVDMLISGKRRAAIIGCLTDIAVHQIGLCHGDRAAASRTVDEIGAYFLVT